MVGDHTEVGENACLPFVFARAAASKALILSKSNAYTGKVNLHKTGSMGAEAVDEAILLDH